MTNPETQEFQIVKEHPRTGIKHVAATLTGLTLAESVLERLNAQLSDDDRNAGWRYVMQPFSKSKSV